MTPSRGTRGEPRQVRSLRRREAILVAAVELIGDGGLTAVTHRKVAERAGVPAGSVWYHFATIDELAAEALQVYAAKAADDYLSAVSDAPVDPEGMLRAVAEVPFTAAAERAQITMYLEGGRNPNLREPVAKVADGYRRIAQHLLIRLGLPPAVADEAAPAFVALFDGFTLWRLARPDRAEPERQLERALTALALGYLLLDDPAGRAEVLARLEPDTEDTP